MWTVLHETFMFLSAKIHTRTLHIHTSDETCYTMINVDNNQHDNDRDQSTPDRQTEMMMQNWGKEKKDSHYQKTFQ